MNNGDDYQDIGVDEYREHGWKFSYFAWWRGLCYFIVGLLLILGTIAFAISLHNGDRIRAMETTQQAILTTQQAQQATLDGLTIPFSHAGPGPLQPNKKLQYITAAGITAMTLPTNLGPYVDDEICLISKTAFAHTLTLGVGATWNGIDTIATFGGAVGDGLCFIVASPTQMFVVSVINVAFS